MQLFYFVLKAGRQIIPDPDGQELPDVSAAQLHAVAVAHQLMRNHEVNTRCWRIQVCDDYLRPLLEVCFADVDETLAACLPDWQSAIKDVARMTCALNDAVIKMHNTLSDVRETLIRADQILASIPGPRLAPRDHK